MIQGVNGTIGGMYFDLDEPISYAQDADNGDGYFKDHVVTLAPGEVQTFSFSNDSGNAGRPCNRGHQ